MGEHVKGTGGMGGRQQGAAGGMGDSDGRQRQTPATDASDGRQ